MSNELKQLRRSIGGRPRLASRKQRISVYLDPEAIRQLKERAKQEGRPISEIIRRSIQA